jgi:hypothetical protein
MVFSQEILGQTDVPFPSISHVQPLTFLISHSKFYDITKHITNLT